MSRKQRRPPPVCVARRGAAWEGRWDLAARRGAQQRSGRRQAPSPSHRWTHPAAAPMNEYRFIAAWPHTAHAACGHTPAPHPRRADAPPPRARGRAGHDPARAHSTGADRMRLDPIGEDAHGRGASIGGKSRARRGAGRSALQRPEKSSPVRQKERAVRAHAAGPRSRGAVRAGGGG
eukprot:gene6195-16039_t